MIPHRIRISERATSRLRFLKSKTGLTPNILSRIAFSLAVRNDRLVTGTSIDFHGQEFNAPTLFGEYQEIYDLILSRYVETTGDNREPAVVIADLIETGLHKMGHVRRLQDLATIH